MFVVDIGGKDFIVRLNVKKSLGQVVINHIVNLLGLGFCSIGSCCWEKNGKKSSAPNTARQESLWDLPCRFPIRYFLEAKVIVFNFQF